MSSVDENDIMAKTIQIELKTLIDIYQVNQNDSLRSQLAQQKKAIHAYRNQRLSHYFKIKIDQESIAQEEHGKPYLLAHPDSSFNHSHSRHFYALAMSEHVADVGVDIEELTRKVRFEALAEHAFHADELQQWHALDCDLEYWFKVWTTKEAVLKASGLGIRLNLNELNTNVHPLHHGGMCEHPKLGIFAYQNYHVGECMLSVAWRSEQSCKGFALPIIQIISEI